MQSTSTVDLLATLEQPPGRTLEQRLAALREANRIRFHRAELKRQLRAGRLAPDEVLEDPDCETMKVVDLLRSLPKVGPVKTNRALNRTRISPSKTLGGLTDRQRDELLSVLPSQVRS